MEVRLNYTPDNVVAMSVSVLVEKGWMVGDLRDCEGFERYSHTVYSDGRAKGKAKGWPPPEVRAPGSYLFITGGPSAGHATWLINRRATSCDWVARLSLVCALVRMRVRRAGYACICLTGPSSPPSVPPPPQTPLSRRCAGAVLLPALALRLSGSCIARRDREACGRDGGG